MKPFMSLGGIRLLPTVPTVPVPLQTDLPMVIQAAGGLLMRHVGASSSSPDAEQPDLVLGVAGRGEASWAQQHLPAGTRVYSRDVLINSVMRGALDLPKHPLLEVVANNNKRR